MGFCECCGEKIRKCIECEAAVTCGFCWGSQNEEGVVCGGCTASQWDERFPKAPDIVRPQVSFPYVLEVES